MDCSEVEASKMDAVDDDGRLWTYDRKVKVWYAPGDGLEFDTLAEVDEWYGPVVEARAASESG